MSKKIYLYDPRYNIKTLTTFKELESLGIASSSCFRTYKCKKMKLQKINKYIIDDSYSTKDLKELYYKEEYKDEIWKDIIGFDHKYKVSNYGRIKKIYKKGENFLLPYNKKNSNEYKFVHLKKNNKFKEYKIYLLVAKAFLNKVSDDTTHVIHKNGIKYDDRASNLEYVTKEEVGKLYGSDANSIAIYKIDNATYEILDTFKSGREAAREDFLCHQSIYDVLNKKSRTCINGNIYVTEDEYNTFTATIDEKKYMLFNCETFEKNNGTIKELNSICNLGIHTLKYMYEVQYKYKNYCLLNIDSEEYKKLYKENKLESEFWQNIDVKNIKNYQISNYGRIKDKFNNILIPEIENNKKIINLENINKEIKKFEIAKLVALYFKKNSYKGKKTYDDLKNYKIYYGDNNFYNCKSTNIEILDNNINLILTNDEKKEKIYLVSKKKKIIKKTYDNIFELSKEINKSLNFIILCIKENRRVNNRFYMFENDCKNFIYE